MTTRLIQRIRQGEDSSTNFNSYTTCLFKGAQLDEQSSPAACTECAAQFINNMYHRLLCNLAHTTGEKRAAERFDATRGGGPDGMV